MKKHLVFLLGLCLCGCSVSRIEKEKMPAFDFRLAVIDNGTSDSEVTYYDSEYHELGRVKMSGRWINPVYSFSRDTLYDDTYAYLAPARGRVRNYSLIRMNLENGQIEYLPLEAFTVEDIFMDEDNLEVIQASPSYTYWRVQLPLDGTEPSITRIEYNDYPGYFFPVSQGWLRFKPIPDCDLLQYDSEFSQVDKLSLGARTPSVSENVPGEEPFVPKMYDAVYMNETLYVPVQKEVRRWQAMEEGIYQEDGLFGYEYGFMKVKTGPLSYEVIGDPAMCINDIEQLDEKRIVLCTSTQKLIEHSNGNETSYYYEDTDLKLTVFDTESEEFTEIETGWQPVSVTRAADVLYVSDINQIIHILDPLTLEEIERLEHSVSDTPYTFAGLVMAEPYR